jgi:hypothetical protein
LNKEECESMGGIYVKSHYENGHYVKSYCRSSSRNGSRKPETIGENLEQKIIKNGVLINRIKGKDGGMPSGDRDIRLYKFNHRYYVIEDNEVFNPRTEMSNGYRGTTYYEPHYEHNAYKTNLKKERDEHTWDWDW